MVGRLIAGARRQKPPKLLLPLILGGGLLGALKALGPSLRGDGGGEVRELLGLERKDLIAGLGRLKRAGRRLARRDQRRHLRAVGVEIADDASLNAQERPAKRRPSSATAARALAISVWLD